jgi:CheY-like chemotaxis protein
MTMARLLIVDDDMDVAEALADALTCEGHTCRVAYDGVEGLQRLGEDRVDLILLDVDMPRMTGPEMAYSAFVRDAGLEKIPILLLSANADLPRVAARVGTPYFLGKPCSLHELGMGMARALAERTPPQPLPG